MNDDAWRWVSQGLGLLIAVAVIGGAVWLYRRINLGPGPGPRCGGCGHGVEDIQALTCPSCGADLREVGIRTWPGSIGLGGRLVLWSLAMSIAGVSANELMPDWEVRIEQKRYATVDGERPEHFRGDSRLTQIRWPWQSSARWEHQSVELTWETAAQGTPLLRVEPRDKTWTRRDADGDEATRPTPITQEAILNWLAAGGRDPFDPDTQMLALRVRGVLGEPTGVYLGWDRVTARENDVLALDVLVLTLGCVIWLAGCVWLYRRRRS